jgi:hypothetical protein
VRLAYRDSATERLEVANQEFDSCLDLIFRRKQLGVSKFCPVEGGRIPDRPFRLLPPWPDVQIRLVVLFVAG